MVNGLGGYGMRCPLPEKVNRSLVEAVCAKAPESKEEAHFVVRIPVENSRRAGKMPPPNHG
jgi:hypothetical protein